jgi:hypothetical protein
MVLMAMLLTSSGLMAQAGTHSSITMLMAGPVSQSCPVGFSASRTAVPVMMATKNTEQYPRLGLQLDFSHPNALMIAKASITVHGASGKGHIIPAGDATDTDRTETFNLQSNPGIENLRSSKVWLKKMSAVSWVDLTEIEYADGSVWHASPISKCRATPSNFLPVNAAAQ